MAERVNKSLRLFRWQGVHSTHIKMQGKTAAKSELALRASLRRQGITRVNIQRVWQLNWPWQNLQTSDTTWFLRQLSITLASGISLAHSLELLLQTTQKPPMIALLEHIKSHIEMGRSLANSLRAHTKTFPETVVQMIHAGEQSGTLVTMLTTLAEHREKTAALHKQIHRALFYPLLVLVIALCISTILLWFVVPTFQNLFASFNAPLPAATTAIIYLSQQLKQQGVTLFFVMTILIGLGYVSYCRVKKLRLFIHQAILKLPFAGTLVQHSNVVHLSNMLAITLNAGIPLLPALQLTQKTLRNCVYQKTLLAIEQQISSGTPLHQAMSHTQHFPTLAIQLVRIGEASGTLSTMLNKIAQTYQEQVNHRVAKLTTLLEPLIMSILGIAVGGLVLAMYLPIFKMGSVI